jgi:hypothetical protein
MSCQRILRPAVNRNNATSNTAWAGVAEPVYVLQADEWSSILFANASRLCEMSGSHGGKYEVENLLGYSAV